MRKTVCSSVLVILGVLSLVAGANPAWARRSKLPNANIFSSPDSTDSAVLPTFVTNAGKPLSEGRPQRVPDFNTIKMVPDLSKDQIKQIEALRKVADIATSGYREQIPVLYEQLDAAKAHPNEMVFVQGKQLKKVDSIRNDINDVRKQIDAKNKEQYQAAIDILTDKQRAELNQIRSGQLVINGAQNADGKPGVIEHDPPGAKKAQTVATATKHPGFWKRLFGRN